MPSPLIYALLSLVFAAAHDVVFKRYAAKDRSRGTYVFGIGLVWLTLQVPTAFAQGMEHFTPRKLAAVVVAVCSIVLLSLA